MHWRQWQLPSILLPGESQGARSSWGWASWGLHTESTRLKLALAAAAGAWLRNRPTVCAAWVRVAVSCSAHILNLCTPDQSPAGSLCPWLRYTWLVAMPSPSDLVIGNCISYASTWQGFLPNANATQALCTAYTSARLTVSGDRENQ